MTGIFEAMCFLLILIIFMIVATYLVLKKNDKVRSSRYILNKLIPRDATPELTEMIEFHKKNKWLEKYNIGVGGQK